MNVICQCKGCGNQSFGIPERLQQPGWRIAGFEIRCPEHNGEVFTSSCVNTVPTSPPEGVLGLRLSKDGTQIDPIRHGSNAERRYGSETAAENQKNLQEGVRPSTESQLFVFSGAERVVQSVGMESPADTVCPGKGIANRGGEYTRADDAMMHVPFAGGMAKADTDGQPPAQILGAVTIKKEIALKLIADGTICPKDVKPMSWQPPVKNPGLISSWLEVLE